MQEPINVKRNDIEPIIRATFPGYKGRKIRLLAREAISLQGLNWDGGSRSQYRACTLEGHMTGGSDRYNAMHPMDNPAEGMRLPIPQGAVVVEHSIFMGKDSGLRVYVNPADMPRLLPAR